MRSWRRIFSMGVTAIVVGSAWNAVATTPTEFKLTASDATEADNFGFSVDMDGDYAIVAARTDDGPSAYIFFNQSGTTWIQQAKLTASDATAAEIFGESVSISGEYAIVGADQDNDNGTGSGSAYVFKRSGTTWTQQAKLTASDATEGDRFGHSVSISGDYVIVGAELDDDGGSNSGSAYIFFRSGTTWTEQAKLTASDATEGDHFGQKVSISGDDAIVGAFLDDAPGVSSGSAYIFSRSGTTWTETTKLTASDATAGDRFGVSVSISGDHAIVGSYLDDNGTGSAYMFSRSGTAWTQQAKLTASDAQQKELFGYSVSVSGDRAIVGAVLIFQDSLKTGSAYIFKQSKANPTTWTEQAKLTASDATIGDHFGTAVSISGPSAIVGATGNDDDGESSGSAYVYTAQRSIEVKVSLVAKFSFLTLKIPIDPFTLELDTDHTLGSDVSGVDFGSAPGLEELVNAFSSTQLRLPSEAIDDDNLTLNIEIQNLRLDSSGNVSIDSTDINGVPTSIFFFLRMFVEKDGPDGKIIRTRFVFNTGSPMVIKIPKSAITNLFENTEGFSGVRPQDVALTYLTDKGDLDREGIQSFIDPTDDYLVIRLSHLSDVVGLKISDIPLPRLATITKGPRVARDTTFADILWETNRLTNSVVKYGTAKTVLDNIAQTEADSALGAFLHFVRLTGLTKSTTYFYQIFSQDQFDRNVSSEVDSFKTKRKGDFNPPVFDTRPRITKITPTEAKAFFVTDRQTTVEIKFGSTKPLTGRFNENTPKRTHNITLGNLTANTKYYAVVSASAGGQTIQSDTLTFTTPSNVDSSPPAFTRQPTVDSFDVSDTTATVSGQADRDVNVAIKYWAKGTTDTVVVYKADESRDLTVELSNLSAETEYDYYMYITDPANDETISSRLGEFKTGTSTRRDFRFRRRPHLAYGSNNRVILTWATNMRSTGVVLFDRVPSGNAFNADDAREIVIDRSRRVHFVTLGSLAPGTRYVFAVFLESRDFQFLDFPEGAAAGKAIAHKPDGTLLITGTIVVPGGSGSFTTNSAPDTQPPVILNGPTAISQTDNTLIVQWDTDELAIGQVNFGTNPINLDQSAIETEQNTSHQVTLTNLTANTAYSFTVDATDPVGNGPTQSGTSASSTTAGADATPPAIDANSINHFPSDVQAIIQWNTDEGSDTEVRYGEDAANLSNTTIDNDVAKEHSLTLTGLTAGLPYYYRTISTDPSGNQSTLTTTKTFETEPTANTTQPNITAGPTETVIAQAGPAVTMTIIWTTDVLATSGVDYDTLSNLSTATSVGSQTGSLNHEVVISGLALDTQYHYQVSSANVHDASLTPPEATSSSQVTTPATLDATAPAAPASVTAISGDGAVRLRWSVSTDDSGIKGYDIKRDDSVIASNVADSTYLDQTAANGTAVVYKIVAVDNANNNSADSNPSTSVIPATTQIPTMPTAGTLPDTVSLRPILLVGNATAVAGEASRATLTYAFEVATDNVFANIVASITGTSEGASTNPTNWQVVDAGTDNTVLVDGTTYFWRSRANDGEFNGTWSDTTSFVAAAAKSLAVGLATLTAISDRGLVVVEWTITRTDPAHAGFHVYRGRTADGEFEQLTEDLLTSVDATYRFVDGDVQVNQQYYYMIEAVNLAGGTERYDPVLLRVNAPATFALKQNAPNPFNPATTIRFELPGPTQVTLIVYNLLGQEVIRLLDHVAYQAGYHQIQWNGRNATGRSTASGIYVYRIAAGDFVQAKKMLLLK